MQSEMSMHLSPRCGARTRQGKPCRAPAVNGRRRCRMHGGTNAGAPIGNDNALKHGCFSADVVDERRSIRRLLKQLHDGLDALD
ncbi:MAG: HGGxSTG domain-containing protein [Geminicoccaceae bacterium]